MARDAAPFRAFLGGLGCDGGLRFVLKMTACEPKIHIFLLCSKGSRQSALAVISLFGGSAREKVAGNGENFTFWAPAAGV